MSIINKICQDLYDGSNFPGMWHGSIDWGKSADFHEHPFFVWQSIQQFFDKPLKPLNIVETGRCSGQSSMLFSAIAQETNGYFYSFDLQDWNRQHIININNKYGIDSKYYNYIVDSSFNAAQYLPSDFKIDVLFLDSLHTYECVKKETLLFETYLSDKAIIFFHDTTWCFDSVFGWILDYLKNKPVSFIRHKDTNKPQCQLCTDLWGTPGKLHGRPQIVNGRPTFQAEAEVNDSPYYNILNYNNIKWLDENFDQALKNNQMIFTNLEASCGIGALFINNK